MSSEFEGKPNFGVNPSIKSQIFILERIWMTWRTVFLFWYAPKLLSVPLSYQIYFLQIISFIYIFTNPSEFIAVNVIRFSVVARIIHSYAYINSMQPWSKSYHVIGARP